MIFRLFILFAFALLASLSVLADEDAAPDTVTPVDDDSVQESAILSGLPSPYRWIKYKKYLYTFHFDHFVDWQEAWDFCFHNGGELVTIETKQEQKVIQHLFRHSDPTGGHNIVWIGAKWDHECSVFEWWYIYVLHKIFYQWEGQYKYKLGYTNWDRGEPSDTTCVGIDISRRSFGKWVTAPCDNHYAYICQWNECQRWSWDPHKCDHERGCFFHDNQCQRSSEVLVG